MFGGGNPDNGQKSSFAVKTEVAGRWDKKIVFKSQKEGETSSDITLTSDKSRNALEGWGLSIYSSDVFLRHPGVESALSGVGFNTKWS